MALGGGLRSPSSLLEYKLHIIKWIDVFMVNLTVTKALFLLQLKIILNKEYHRKQIMVLIHPFN